MVDRYDSVAAKALQDYNALKKYVRSGDESSGDQCTVFDAWDTEDGGRQYVYVDETNKEHVAWQKDCLERYYSREDYGEMSEMSRLISESKSFVHNNYACRLYRMAARDASKIKNDSYRALAFTKISYYAFNSGCETRGKRYLKRAIDIVERYGADLKFQGRIYEVKELAETISTLFNDGKISGDFAVDMLLRLLKIESENGCSRNNSHALNVLKKVTTTVLQNEIDGAWRIGADLGAHPSEVSVAAFTSRLETINRMLNEYGDVIDNKTKSDMFERLDEMTNFTNPLNGTTLSPHD